MSTDASDDANLGGPDRTTVDPPYSIPAAMWTQPPLGERPGDSIGPYKLLSVLGEGGFGVVYLAERRQPHVQRVALKIIKPGMDSRAVIARFEQERQALAVMDHPNVARVFDAGTTAAGRPYFVMEHVQGEPVTTYCDRHNLTIKQRLELFIPVCEAVQHAHMKGIIHRDIKPSNVLVTVKDGAGGPIPKGIDFGVAKAISHTLTDKTIFTEQGQIIGTPEYMSPEQAEMGAVDIDTRSDVYSLGVVLYELLTGTLPFDPKELRSKGYAEIQRIIREVEAPRPSTKLTSLPSPTGRGAGGEGAPEAHSASAAAIASHRQTKLDDLVRMLRRELEWIPLKAMRKDRTQRYATAKDLADDLGNYLQARPLVAGPVSRWYRARKVLRSHRKVISLCCLIIMLIMCGVGFASWRASEARFHEYVRLQRQYYDEFRGWLTQYSRINVEIDRRRESLQQLCADRHLPGFTAAHDARFRQAISVLSDRLAIVRHSHADFSSPEHFAAYVEGQIASSPGDDSKAPSATEIVDPSTVRRFREFYEAMKPSFDEYIADGMTTGVASLPAIENRRLVGNEALALGLWTRVQGHQMAELLAASKAIPDELAIAIERRDEAAVSVLLASLPEGRQIASDRVARLACSIGQLELKDAYWWGPLDPKRYLHEMASNLFAGESDLRRIAQNISGLKVSEIPNDALATAKMSLGRALQRPHMADFHLDIPWLRFWRATLPYVIAAVISLTIAVASLLIR